MAEKYVETSAIVHIYQLILQTVHINDQCISQAVIPAQLPALRKLVNIAADQAFVQIPTSADALARHFY